MRRLAASFENGLATGSQNRLQSAVEVVPAGYHYKMLFYFTERKRSSFSQVVRPVFAGEAMHAKRSLALKKAKGVKPRACSMVNAFAYEQGDSPGIADAIFFPFHRYGGG